MIKLLKEENITKSNGFRHKYNLESNNTSINNFMASVRLIIPVIEKLGLRKKIAFEIELKTRICFSVLHIFKEYDDLFLETNIK